jgi:creatinine amidohydrolase
MNRQTTTALRPWGALCTNDFAHLDPHSTVAVLPVGATEQHGPHLALSVDTSLVEGVLGACALHMPSHCPVLVLPTQAVGFSPEHQRFAGTLTLRAETTIRLWTEIGESVARAGVRKLLIFNGHGGQVGLMDVVARDLRARLDMLVYCVNWYDLPLHGPGGEDLNAQLSPEERRFGIHGGQVETAMMLALAPDRVNPAQAKAFTSTSAQRAATYPVLGNGRSAKWGWQMQDYNPEGAVGRADLATVAFGNALVSAAGQALAALLQEVASLPLTMLVPKPHGGGPLTATGQA